LEHMIHSLFAQYEHFAFLISILLNIIIAVLAFIPSTIMTAANILFFGFWEGTMLSFIGESVGAIVSFYLYRRGFNKFNINITNRFMKKLLYAEGIRAFLLVFSFRLFPYVPSSIVTIGASLGSISILSFSLASSLGKIPAILIESYSIYYLVSFPSEGKMGFVLFALLFFGVFFLKKTKKTN